MLGFFLVLQIQYSILFDGKQEEKLLVKQFSELIVPFSCLSVFASLTVSVGGGSHPFPSAVSWLLSTKLSACLCRGAGVLNWCPLERLQGKRLL
ncbi:similar to nudix (nucleoside diphosphate linked moiety X)-type motif 11 (predicted) [Rattus norvegicus]|uniref:Similar to nudix (Nucleoside diphosphate linked moiety X)-type motif 11 (Predicted) n=1 Tax=Rattus norvegicus TaxID=10116 RepID=A6KPC4_RAT|nr:similar to nudix (nucleoside diphosphate linked moiety X)-type motif 11 (predicted) [Rattus norvegicus]